ncbi:hypothetical protein [Massilia sp. X63]|uniref:hypothetical protein n=1 Tax=Massilia sp. X63 TaxID=3237285 RepID=UPI0034DCD2E4
MKSTKITACIVFAVAAQALALPALAQESAYADLDACTRGEQMKLTAKGAVAGMVAGFAGAILSGKKENTKKAALLGMAGGAAAGFATAYYTAIDTCKKQNPQWITEASLVRDPSRSLKQVKSEHGYQPRRDGVMVALKEIESTATIKAGEPLSINTYYDVMTPDDAEALVAFERKLFVTVDGQEAEVPFPQTGHFERKVEAGRSREPLVLPTLADAKPGTIYRVTMSAAAGGKAPVTVSKSITVI